MRPFGMIFKELEHLNSFSKNVIIFSFWLSTFLFILAFVSLLNAGGPDYFHQIAIHRTAMEAAPSTFVAGLLCALLCDLIHRDRLSK